MNQSPFSAISPAAGLGPYFTRPTQVRDLTFVALGVTFDRPVVEAMLPPNLTGSEDGTGGFLVALARQGHRLTPFSTSHVWFDVQGMDGTAGPCRFLPASFNATTRSGHSMTDQGGGASICESVGMITASLKGGVGGPACRFALRPSGTWSVNSGLDHCIASGGPGHPARRMTVTPWACDWCDAGALSLHILSPDWADLAPVSLNWARWARRLR